MKKYNNILIKNIVILLTTGAVTKILGMIGKIIYTRTAGIDVVSLYALITPTLMLIISITQFSFPITISKLSAEEKYNNEDLLKNTFFIAFIINIIIIIFVFLTSNLIASLLHNNSLGSAIKSIIFILPFITTSSILRGFLHGKENMMVPSITNIIEEIIKIILIIAVLPIALSKSNILAVIFIILFNILTELPSIYFMKKEINKKYILKKRSYLNIKIIKEILSISLPTTFIRLISSLGFFLEPIILTNLLINKGFSNEYITLQYGIINSYVIPLLSMPSFFSMSISSAVLPNLTKTYFKKKYEEFNNKLLKMVILSIIVGLICLLVILIFPSEILNIIYGIDIGINYLYLVGPFFLIVYIQPVLSVAMQSMNKTNKLLKVSIVSMILKYSSLSIFCVLDLGINSLIYAMIIGIITTSTQEMIIVLKHLKKISSYDK